MQSAPDERTAVLTRMAQNEGQPKKPEELFFAELKAKVVHAYYTSEIGIKQEMDTRETATSLSSRELTLVELGSWGAGELGNWGEPGNWGAGSCSGNWGTRELGNWGAGELGSWGTGGLGELRERNWGTGNRGTGELGNWELGTGNWKLETGN